MSHNPYSPPATPVADLEEARVRPWSVNVALILFCSSIALAIPKVIIDMVRGNPASHTPDLDRLAMVIGLTVVSALAAVLFAALWKGWRWGRIVYAALVALAIIEAFTSVPQNFARHWYFGVADVLSNGFDIAAVWLVFTAGNAWFRPSGASSRS
jgi:cation transport ATPase